jgi:lipid-A-disaccharide synthase-like uncharacterized protein
MQFSLASRHSSHSSPNTFLGTVFSDILHLFYFLIARDQVSYPYKTTGKIIDMYILIFMFLENRRK